MRSSDKKFARRQLDKRLMSSSFAQTLKTPPRGWIKAIREALGMTTAQFAKRMEVSQPRVVAIEKAEKSGSITLETLERAARALNCELVYALVPRKPLDDMAYQQAYKLARKRLERTSHSMALEDQSVSAEDLDEQLDQLAQLYLDMRPSKLWEDQ